MTVKRKVSAIEPSSPLVPRKLKYSSKKTTEQNKFAKFRQTTFDKYKDTDNADIIGPDGCQVFFSDIGVSLESIVPILLAWKMNCARMGYITIEEWSKFMKDSKQVAVALWQVILADKYPIIKSFMQFIEEKKPIKVINKDQWASMLDLCKTIPEDLSGYDSVSSWPVLFDHFAEWKKEGL
ncbi:hypothetical protein RO3G_10004 [Rhizopus delemar RA 99-880]|uniref:Defective in cullin neddylation protein n=1 Tax=Rhizopus delemar (strain RA 99-880 / ATCC MYA-4621 / FGSC 9543 / NRRL 43880) TaxID=246409 RepID=I1CA14_RHIO9|nr:hypothetical protein RO3G_10004 [Rhizopus delemar RA 99-880]|eukprot:EIE85294.1 hypothetical protein RO3G_10004 [Rhizopus delemar RA 99-880]